MISSNNLKHYILRTYNARVLHLTKTKLQVYLISFIMN